MTKIIKIFVLFLLVLSVEANAQEIPSSEKYGKTLNMGAGIGYHGYFGSSLPMANLNFEFDVAKNFTLAPFIGISSYHSNYYWRNKNYPERYYSYRTLVVPVGVKGTYYFDQLLKANVKWDFYAAASIGFLYRKTVWENEYYGDANVVHHSSPLYLMAHIGAEYHITNTVGLFLDLSTGVSTFGLAIHF